jgi:hypothetical protein
MRFHIKFIKILLTHKWYVFIYCLKLGVPIHIALWHDMSKLSYIEYLPYVHKYVKSWKEIEKGSRLYDPNSQPYEFQKAWLHHQRNKHHWQAWCSIADGGAIVPIDMPEVYIKEMIADWISAGKTYSTKSDPVEWYNEHKDKLVFSKKTQELLEKILYEYFNQQ